MDPGFFYLFVIFTVDFLKKEWKNMRENMKRCIVRRAEMTRSGAPSSSLPKCKYFSQLQFIRDKIMNKETDSNLNLNIVPPSPVDASCNSEPIPIATHRTTEFDEFPQPVVNVDNVQNRKASSPVFNFKEVYI